jgi:hypothetical protein
MPTDDGRREVGSTVEEETTRVEAVRHLQGASGHGVVSLVMLAVAGGLFVTGLPGVAALAVVVAYGVALNGFSIWAWDELRAYVETELAGDDRAPSRTLTPHRPSAEMSAELVSGALLVGGFLVLVALALALLRVLTVRQTVVVAVVGLAAANLGALWWTVGRSS